MTDAQAGTGNAWFYAHNGERKGPVSHNDMIQLIKSSVVSRDTAVWKEGFSDWLTIEDTDLRTHLDTTAPPPLSDEKINNTVVWLLAFAPLIGYVLEWVVAGAVHGGNQLGAAIAMENGQYWFITLVLNISLAFLDEKRLKAAGHDTEKFKGWVWLVPVYLYQRAQATKANLAYFIVWIVCFILVLID